MKKLIFTTVIAFATITLNAQIKVWTGGKTAFGQTTTSPTAEVDILNPGGYGFRSSLGSGSTTLDIWQTSSATSPGARSSVLFSNSAYEIYDATNSASRFWISTGGNIGIGNTSPSSLLSVGGNGNSLYLANFYNASTTNGSVGVYSSVASPTSSTNGAYCIYGGMTCGTGYAFGIKGSSYNSTAQTTGNAIGIFGQAGNATSGYNWGVAGILIGSNNGAGIYGSDNVTAGLHSIGGNYAGYFYGKIGTTNDSPEKPTAGSWSGPSDMRLKKDTAAFKDGLAVLRKVHPVTYKFTGVGGLPTAKTNIGVIAQEIQKIAPYCIGTSVLVVKQAETSNFGSDVVSSKPDTGGVGQSLVNVLTYNYDGLIYVLINSVKQLDSTVTVLQKQLAAKAGQRSTNNNPDSVIKILQKQVDDLINNCCNKTAQNTVTHNNTGNGNITPNGNTLNNSSAILYPNVPNPFNVSTNIKCFIPDASKAASLLIFDMNGTLKKTILLNGKGEVNTTINAKEFIAGMYFYTLIIDGAEIDTKKMILTEQ